MVTTTRLDSLATYVMQVRDFPLLDPGRSRAPHCVDDRAGDGSSSPSTKGIRVIGQRLHAYLRAGAGDERQQVGPFLATFTPGSTHPMRNYAVPDDDAAPTPDQIAALIAAYETRGLRPRLEYSSSAAPALASALIAAGFTIETTIPVLTCEPGQQRLSQVDGVVVSDATDERDHEDAMRVAGVAFGGPDSQVSASAVAASIAMAAAGGAVGIARDEATGEPVGSARYPVPVDGVTEVTSLGTVPEYRRRGVATAVLAHLADRALRRGVRLLWLTADNDASRHASEGAGFRDTGESMVHISLPR